MRGIIKALILGWIGKKIYDRVTDTGGDEEAAKPQSKPRSAAHRKPSARRTGHKTARRAA
jgi:hypothetical protein